MDRNQELLARVRQLQEREAEAEEKMKEQLQRHSLCQQGLDAASRKLREKEDSLAEAGEVRGCSAGTASREGRAWSHPQPVAAGECPWLILLCLHFLQRCDHSKNINFPFCGFQLIS